jgi:outer membrane lipoprotein-sorting protein
MRRWFMGVAVTLVAAGIATADDKAEAIVKKGVDAHGGADNLNKYKGGRCKMKGDLHVMGLDLEVTGSLVYSLPDRYRMEIDTEIMGQKLTINQTVKGDKVKSTITIGGMTMNAPDANGEKDELKLAAAMQEAEQLTPLLDKKKFTIKAGDEEEVNGRKASVVVVTPATIKKDFKLFFDKDSGLMVKTAHRGLGPGDGGASVEVLEETYVSDYKKVNGVQVPMKMEIKHDDKKFMAITLSDYELVEKIDDKEFTIDD